MKKTNDFGRDSVPLLVLKTSIPFMFAQFVNVLYSIVDRIYIGNIPGIGGDSLAGAGVCAPIITLLSSFAALIGIGGSVTFSVKLAPHIRLPHSGYRTKIHGAGFYRYIPCYRKYIRGCPPQRRSGFNVSSVFPCRGS